MRMSTRAASRWVITKKPSPKAQSGNALSSVSPKCLGILMYFDTDCPSVNLQCCTLARHEEKEKAGCSIVVAG